MAQIFEKSFTAEKSAPQFTESAEIFKNGRANGRAGDGCPSFHSGQAAPLAMTRECEGGYQPYGLTIGTTTV
jgi:hypothetical protein